MSLNAERLTKTYPSPDVLLYGKGKDAFTFPDSTLDDGFLFGSVIGEYCLLRIRIESSQENQRLRIGSITGVQMLYQSGGTVHLRIAEVETRPLCKEVVVVMEPEALRRRVSSGSPSDIERSGHRDARFQLHIKVELVDSDRQVDIAKTICWRTISAAKSALLFGAQGICRKHWKCRQYIPGAGLLFHSSKTENANHPAKNRTRVHDKVQHPPASSAVSWNASF